MSKNGMIINEKNIIKKLSNSEAAIDNQIRGIKDRTVAAYYLCDIKDYPTVKDFFENGIEKVIVPFDKMNEYFNNVQALLKPYSSFYKNKLTLYESNYIFFNEDVELSGLIFEQRGTRIFFYFKDRNDIDQKFSKCIIGGITNIHFERRNNCMYVFLSLVEDIAKQILKEKTNISKEELASILDGYIDYYSPIDVGIRKFGIDFAEIFEKKIYTVNEVLEVLNPNDKHTYSMRIFEGIDLSKVLPNRSIYLNLENDLRKEELLFEKNDNNEVGYNKIFYGIPGCGKSYTISAMLSHKEGFVEKAKFNGIEYPVDEEDIVRTTFYLDYSNSDFIGQIYPVVDGKGNVKYEYVPGPFTKALTKAYLQKNMVYLVIEEINRGNAAAIFGDLFQLLDRLKVPQGDRVGGDSEYPISNSFIEGYFIRTNKEREKEGKDLIKYKEGQIFIPHNLTILATMNTSDQNVFPLDTAFKRRWERERVEADIDKCAFKDKYIPFTNWTWKDFVESINKKISTDSNDGMILEDKKIGPYFIDEKILVEKEKKDDHNDEENKRKLKKFVYNVIDYLYNDVAKFNSTYFFEEKISFDDICKKIDAYCKNENNDFDKNIYLKSGILNKYSKNDSDKSLEEDENNE